MAKLLHNATCLGALRETNAMPKRLAWLAGFAALALAQPLFAKTAPAAPDSALAVGTVISSREGTVIGGWHRIYGATYVKRTHFTGVTSETSECCFAVFEKGQALLVLKTETAGLDAGGKPVTERIIGSKWITRKPSEIITDCQILWISPQLSLYDNKTEVIRSVVIENGEFVIFSWRDSGSSCSFGD
jgi:hypothetical protein